MSLVPYRIIIFIKINSALVTLARFYLWIYELEIELAFSHVRVAIVVLQVAILLKANLIPVIVVFC